MTGNNLANYENFQKQKKKIECTLAKEKRFTPVIAMKLFGPTRGENYKCSLFTIMTLQKVSLPFERPPHYLRGLKTIECKDTMNSLQIVMKMIQSNPQSLNAS